jgi:hypothetical protein
MFVVLASAKLNRCDRVCGVVIFMGCAVCVSKCEGKKVHGTAFGCSHRLLDVMLTCSVAAVVKFDVVAS